MHDLLDRYSDACGAVIERHGGTVEGFIGDAVVGVFGLAELHEDDALRAVRAAVELREAGRRAERRARARARRRRSRMKLGVESGEVFVSAGTRRSPFAAGDAFNVAARLEGTAPEGEILLGENIYEPGRRRRASGATRAARASRAGRRRSRPGGCSSWRPTTRRGCSRPRRPFVGRERELEELHAAFAQRRGERGMPRGDRGRPGRDRQVAARAGARGRARRARPPSWSAAAPPTARASTYRPARRDRPAARRRRPAPSESRSSSRATSGWRDWCCGAIGLSEGAAQTEETFWAVRRLLERAGAASARWWWSSRTSTGPSRRCSTCSSTSSRSRAGTRSCCVCLARPELARDPAGMGRRRSPNRSLLDARSRSRTRPRAALVEQRRRRRARVGARRRASSRWPRATRCSSSSSWRWERRAASAALPRRIQAVLAARIDRLEPGERARARARVGPGPELLRRARSRSSARERSSRARHPPGVARAEAADPRRPLGSARARTHSGSLTRSSARPPTRGCPRQRRAELHEHVARWLGELARTPRTRRSATTSARRIACSPSSVVPGERERALAAAAAQRLAAAADSALLRGDPPAAARLLERAEALLESRRRGARRAAARRSGPRCSRRVAWTTPLAFSTRRSSGRPSRACGPARRSSASSCASRPSPSVGNRAGAEAAIRRGDAACSSASGDDYGQCRAWLLRGQLAWNAGRVGECRRGLARGCGVRRAAPSDERELFEVIGWRAMAAALGPTPVDEAIRRCEEFRELVAREPDRPTASTLNPLGAAARHGGRLRGRRAAARGGRRDARTSSAASAPASLTWRRREAARRAARARRGAPARGRRDAVLDERGERAGDHHGACSPRPCTPRAAWRRPASCAG